MRFLIDAQLPPLLTVLLKDAGHEAVHVQEVNLARANDSHIWRYAVAQKMVIFTKDEDFAARITLESDGPAIVWLRVGNCTNKAFQDWLIPHLPYIVRRLQEGDKLIEIV